MKNLLTLALCLIPMMLSAQGPIIRNPVTTNQFMNLPQDGWIAIWNNVAQKWSNAVNTASNTNLPAYLQTATLTNLAGTGLNSAATNASALLPNMLVTGISSAATNASPLLPNLIGTGISSAATNPSALLPNMIVTGISQGATNAGFYIASTAGLGTNTTLRNATNSVQMDFRPTGGAGNYSTASFYDDLGVLGGSIFGSVLLNFAGGMTNGVVMTINGSDKGFLVNGTMAVQNGSFYSQGSNFLGATKLTDGKTANSVLGVDVNTNLVALSLSGLAYHASGNVLSNSSGVSALTVNSNRLVTGNSAGNVTNASKRFYFETNVAPILSNLIAAASSGDVVELGNGTFFIGTQTLVPPVGVSIKGRGIDNTIISGTVGLNTNVIAVLGSTNTWEDLTITAEKRGTYLQAPMGSDVQVVRNYTNFVIRRVKLIGESDALDSVNTVTSDGVMEDCELISKWDSFRVLGNSASITHRWKVRRTRIYADMSGATETTTLGINSVEPITVQGGVFEFTDCEVIGTNANFSTAIRVNAACATNYILFSGGRIESAATNYARFFENEGATGGAAVAPIVVFGSSGSHSNSAASSITTFMPYEASTLAARSIKFTGGQAPGTMLSVTTSTNVGASGINVDTSTNVTGAQDITLNRNLAVGQDLSVSRDLVVTRLSQFNNTVNINSGVGVIGGASVDDLYVSTSLNPASTNIIHSLANDSSPANGDFVITEDVSTGLLKKVSLGNLPSVGLGEANVNGEASVTNATRIGFVNGKAGITNLLRSIQAGFGASLTNQGTNVMAAVDSAVIPTHTQLNTASNTLFSSIGTPSGGSGAIQFVQGSNFRGTNDPGTQQFSYDATNSWLVLLKAGGPGELRMHPYGLVKIDNGILYFGTSGKTNWQISNLSDFSPTITDTYDIGTSALRVRTNWLRFSDLSSGLAFRDSTSINSGRGTILKHPDDWKTTNRLAFAITNAQSRQRIGINTATYSGGIADIVLTNEPIDAVGSGMFLRDTNMWFDGGVSTLYSNVFTSTSGGVTNIIATNVIDGETVHLWFWASNGVTVNFPQFVAQDYMDGAVVTPNTNCWTHVIIDRRNTTTNITVFTAGLAVAFGNGVEANTNYVTRTITLQYNIRTTNYPTGAFTVNCSTDVRAQVTNVVASNYGITLATPVIGTSGSISLVSDGVTARTLAILAPQPATITWMSTNWTANSTSILTSVSKRTLFAYRVGMGTDGISTNISCWSVNQTP